MKRKALGIVIIIVFAILLIYCICAAIVKYSKCENVVLTFLFGFDDIANTAVGALLGFGASLFLENYLVDKSKEKAVSKLIDEILSIDEIMSKVLSPEITIMVNGEVKKYANEQLKDCLNALSVESVKNDKYIECIKILESRIIDATNTIYMPIWDSVLQNGDLLKFKDKGYFDLLIRIYTRIVAMRELINNYHQGGYKHIVAIKTNFNKLSQDIDSILINGDLLKIISKSQTQKIEQRKCLCQSNVGGC